ncbi:unnamed protein product [Sphagnum tenellum]
MESEEINSLRLRLSVTKPDHSTESPTNFGRQAEPEEPVTPCGRLFIQPSMNCYIMCTLGFKNPINLPELRVALEETLVKHKRFHSVMKKNAKGTEVWVPADVDINAHVFEPFGFSEEDFAAPSFVEKYVANLATAPPMSFSRPLWECHILNGTSGDAAAHLIFRLHHSLGDGASLMSLLLACTRRVDHPDTMPSIPAKKLKQNADPHIFLLTSLWKTLILIWNTVTGIAYFMATVFWLKDSDTKIKGHAGVGRAQKSLMYAVIDIDDMRIVKNAVNGTINDVLMGIIGAGLQRYLEGQHKDLTKPAGICLTFLQANMWLVNMEELASMMEGGSQTQWGNQLGYLIFPIPLKHSSDPLDCVRAAKKTGNQMKASLEAAFTYWSGALLMSITGPVLPTWLTEHVTLQMTLAVSNVSGPLEPVTLFGNPIVHMYAITAGHPVSLSIFFQSYAGKGSLVVETARDLIPDPETLCQYMVDALQEMKQAVVSRRQASN